LFPLKDRIVILDKPNIVNANPEAIPNVTKTNLSIYVYSIINIRLKSNTYKYDAMNMNVDVVRIEVSTVDKTKKCL
jgi:hypothetical protein